MAKDYQEPPNKPMIHSRTKKSSHTNWSSKISIFILIICTTLIIFFQIHSLHILPSSSSALLQSQETLSWKLQNSITFLPLKDLRFSGKAQEGHTWFMSSLYDRQEEGEVQYQMFPSQESKGRLLCIKGKDRHDGAWNSYALAWIEALPINTTLIGGLTFISYNHYSYENIWHGLSAIFPFVAWHMKNGCHQSPNRWILYHWGEVRIKMVPWLSKIVESSFGDPLNIENFDWYENNDNPICFEKAVVMRHNEGGISRPKRQETYEYIRCKARKYCNIEERPKVDGKGDPIIGMTLLLRSGPRSFRNESQAIRVFRNECAKVKGCKLIVEHANNLTHFCDQVKLMSKTDILISQHGAQTTNMFLMDRNSSFMEFFPKGWKELAGIGQYIYHWLASWSGMRHEGEWRDPHGHDCPWPQSDRRCMSLYKDGTIGVNESFIGEWSRRVLNEVKVRKLQEDSLKNNKSDDDLIPDGCGCH